MTEEDIQVKPNRQFTYKKNMSWKLNKLKEG